MEGRLLGATSLYSFTGKPSEQDLEAKVQGDPTQQNEKGGQHAHPYKGSRAGLAAKGSGRGEGPKSQFT